MTAWAPLKAAGEMVKKAVAWTAEGMAAAAVIVAGGMAETDVMVLVVFILRDLG